MKKVEIQKLDSRGRGIGYLDKPIFLFDALPGEVVEFDIKKEKKKYMEGYVTSIVTPSMKRVMPICPYFGICGGCDIMHLSYPDALDFKYEKVRNTIHSLVDENILIHPILSDSNLYYRNKAILNVDEKLGYFKKESHDIIPISSCYLVLPKINQIISLLNRCTLFSISSILIRSSVFYDDSMVVFYLKEECDLSRYVSLLKNEVSTIVSCFNGKYTVLTGSGYIKERLGNFDYKISPESFFQVNTNMASKLYQVVYDSILEGDTVLDLYCGTGSIGIFLSSKAGRVRGVEVNTQAILDAKQNKEMNGLDNVSFVCLDTSLFEEDLSCYDTIIVDPPRSGLNQKTISSLLDSNVKKIIYVSCDLMTLCRDLNVLKEKYEIKEVTPADLFPNTYHVESVCVLERK